MTVSKHLLKVLIAVSPLLACSEKNEQKTSVLDKEAGADVGAASDVLTTVSAGMLPDSLDTEASSLRLEAGGPCAGTDGFFDCQPNLLKIYLGISKSMITIVNTFLGETAEGISALGVGSGTLESEDAEGLTSIQYDIKSATEYELLMKTEAGPFMYFKVDGNTYELSGDMTHAPAEDDEDGGSGRVHTTVVYTDANNFDIDVKLTGMACDDTDIQAPESIDVKILKTAGVWQGKAMLYMPRWLTNQDATCSVEPSDSTKMFMYTDFVGNDQNTTAALYMASTAVTTAEELSDWTAADFCSNFTGTCQNGYGFGDTNPVSTYKNNFCISAETAVWDTNCTSTEEKISTATFSPASEWILPADLDSLTVTVPDSL